MSFSSQMKFNNIKFTRQQIFERTKLLPMKPKSIGSFDFQFKGLKLREEKGKGAFHTERHPLSAVGIFNLKTVHIYST